MKAEDMSVLFDVGVDDLDQGTDSNDYDVTESDASSLSFSDRVEDAKSLMKPDIAPEPEVKPEPVSENEIIVDAMKSKKQSAPQPEPEEDEEDEGDEDLEIPGDVEQEVENDIAKFSKKLQENLKGEGEQTEEAEEAKTQNEDQTAEDNPLNLSGTDWQAYKQLKKKFPQFTLYDGNPAYKDFYRKKVTVLVSMLSTFELIKIEDRYQELSEIPFNFFIGERQVATPDLIRVRLDGSYRARVRVSELLVQALGQFPAWQRYCEMLRSKLWKDHEMKGAHRRDGLTMEHMSDIEGYVSKLQGFIEQARHCDNMLRAAADSLSRQLTCLQLNEPTGFNQSMEHKLKPQAPSLDSSELEDLDAIEDGSVIRAPVSRQEPAEVDYGVPSDDLAELG